MARALCLVFAGVGKDALLEHVDTASDSHDIVVTDAAPRGDWIGAPIFGDRTGVPDGTLSATLPLPPEARIVVVTGNPDPAHPAAPGADIWAACRARHPGTVDMVPFSTLQADRGALLQLLGDPAPLPRPDAAEAAPDGMLFFDYYDFDYGHYSPARKYVSAHPRRPLNGRFGVTGLKGGAIDVIGRIALVHDVMTASFDIPFDLPDYTNHHSPEFDAFQAFGLRDSFRHDDGGPGAASLTDRHIRLSEVVFHILNDDRFFEDGIRYLIVPDMYEVDPRIEVLTRYRTIERRFFKALRYVPAAEVFPPDTGATRVVFHLRRSDICGDLLFAGTERRAIPIAQHREIVSRPLLTIDAAMRALEDRLAPGAAVDLVIASDGVERMRGQLAGLAIQQDRLDRIERDLLKPVSSDRLKVTAVDWLIGHDSAITRRTLDAMYQADLVITASSAFPQIICHLGGTDLIKIRP